MEGQLTRKLVLAGGQEFYGQGFGGAGDALCEIVFNTAMVGYQEVICDPSHFGQAVVMTYPLIGNCGMTDSDMGGRAYIGALIVRDYNPSPSNFRYTRTLGEILEEQSIPGISGVDTRMITRIIRDAGPQAALITDADTTREECAARIAAFAPPQGAAAQVGARKLWYARTSNPRFTVVAVDCGLGRGIIGCLNRRRVNVTVVPPTITAREVLALHPDGLFLGNGPGNPAEMPQLAALVGELKGSLPIFGAGLGCQLIAMAYGAQVSRMRCGHRGGNHPVRHSPSGLVEITSQNHGYVIDKASLKATALAETHTSLMDGTVEGVACPADQVWAVQFHPSETQAPAGGTGFFDSFANIMLENAIREGQANA